MAIPDYLSLPTEGDYKKYFIENYCNECPIFTWDGLPVMFYPDMFLSMPFIKGHKNSGALKKIK